MPMTQAGLEEVGLRDWPGWWRELNPGYFVGERALLGRGGRRRGRGCTGGCCGGHGGVSGCGGERVRAVGRKEEAGERVMEKLKGLEKVGHCFFVVSLAPG